MNIIEFFTTIEKSTWQDVTLSSILIPVVILLYTKLREWLGFIRPLTRFLNGCLDDKKEILIFLSQLSGANDKYEINSSQKYVTFFPQPLPGDANNIGAKKYQNIDPVWTQSDGKCTAEIFNVLGRANKIDGVRIADTKKDWGKLSNPIFSIGFNPKTVDLIAYCDPLYFTLSSDGLNLSIEGTKNSLGCTYPKDAGILQKTFIKGTTTPVFILAGLGTSGTEVSGTMLQQNCIELGKLYGRKSFCLLFETDITKVSEYCEIKGAYPKPPWYSAVFYPCTYFRWSNKKLFK